MITSNTERKRKKQKFHQDRVRESANSAGKTKANLTEKQSFPRRSI